MKIPTLVGNLNTAMELILLVLIAFLVAANLVFLFTQKNRSSENGPQADFIKFEQQLMQLEKQMKDDFQRSRENQRTFKQQRKN